jgi:hypothetical protein
MRVFNIFEKGEIEPLMEVSVQSVSTLKEATDVALLLASKTAGPGSYYAAEIASGEREARAKRRSAVGRLSFMRIMR